MRGKLIQEDVDFDTYVRLCEFAHQLFRSIHLDGMANEEADERIANAFAKDLSGMPTGQLAEFLVSNNPCLREAARRVVSSRLTH